MSLPVDQAKRLAESEIKVEVAEEKDAYRIVSYHPPPFTPISISNINFRQKVFIPTFPNPSGTEKNLSTYAQQTTKSVSSA